MKRKTRWPVLAAVALLALAAGMLLFRYEAGLLLPRFAKALDLTDRALTEVEYETLQEAMPDCRITWSVPLTEKRVPSDTESLSLEDLRPEDVKRLDFLPALTELEITAPSDYSLVEGFSWEHPRCRVRYPVTLGESSWEYDCQAISVADPEPEALAQVLAHMPNLQEVTLTGTLPEAEALMALRSSFPDISFHWTVELGNGTYPEDTRALVYEGDPCTEETLRRAPSLLPELTSADVSRCGFNDETMFSLCQAFPQVAFPWQVPIGDSFFPWDATELELSGIPFDSAQQVEALLPCFPYLERVVMCRCGLDNKTMDALNQKYENIRFVWDIVIRFHHIRTDATYFYPFKLDKRLYIDNEEASLLRYCTDMVCIDIGHNGAVTDCEWAAYMPKLRYLIIGETGISDLSPLANCKELVYLEMFTIPVTDYAPLVGCTALEDLNLGKTYCDPTPLAQMTWLKNLWWCGAPTRNLPSTPAMEILPEALPNTTIKFWLEHPTASGWRKLDNYFAMRDYMGMFYLT